MNVVLGNATDLACTRNKTVFAQHSFVGHSEHGPINTRSPQTIKHRIAACDMYDHGTKNCMQAAPISMLHTQKILFGFVNITSQKMCTSIGIDPKKNSTNVLMDPH